MRNRLLLMGKKKLVPGASAIYLFNEGTGTTLTDYSGNARDGTLGAAAAAPTWATEGLTFDGGDLVLCGTAADGSATGLTVQVVANVAANTFQTLVSKQTETFGTGKAGFGLVKDTTAGKYLLYAATAAGDIVTVNFASHTNSTWGLVTAVADGTVIYGYTGTTPSATQTACVGVAPAAAQQLTIGRLSYGAAWFLTGGIAAVLIYPFALAPSQVAQNDAALKGMLAPRGIVW